MPTTEIAVFGGGCFWCTEAVFKMFRGVVSVTPGYAGGAMEKPNYDMVTTGKTGHAEVIQVEYDPSVITFKQLLTTFFTSHDATTLNRQGADVGTQYRSIILYTTEQQAKEANDFIQELNNTSKEGGRITTEVTPLEHFYEAEGYHKDYYERNSSQPYCQIVINPKLAKVKKELKELLKTHGEE